jgi:tRNA(fMet)-specific endonuclease VapC
MAERILIDTSAIIKYLNETLPVSGLSYMDKVLDIESIISFITKIELMSWNSPNSDDIEIYRLFISKSIIIGIDDVIIQETIRIRKSYKLKLPDALIAATAIINDMMLVADNDKDFKKIKELTYFNPNIITT